MAATLEWDLAYTLTTPYGSLVFNADDQLGTAVTGGLYLLDPAGCAMGAPLRVSVDDVPQDDGSIVHPVLTGGYRARILLRLLEHREQPACGETLVLMNDLLMRHLNSLRGDGGGRLAWNPSGSTPERMIDDIWWFEDLTAEFDGVYWKIQFGVISPFPYAMDAAEATTAITDGNTGILDNEGSARFKPVVKVFGPTSNFEVTNLNDLDDDGNPQKLVYDASLPGAVAIGGGDYVEFDFFRETAYLNGSGANRKSGIDIVQSDFWALLPEPNSVTITGADCDVLWQSAWV